MPTVEEAQRLVAKLGARASRSTRSGSSCCSPAASSWRARLKAEGKRVFLDMKLLDIGNTVERAVANATELGVDFLTVHGHDLKTLRAAVAGPRHAAS